MLPPSEMVEVGILRGRDDVHVTTPSSPGKFGMLPAVRPRGPIGFQRGRASCRGSGDRRATVARQHMTTHAAITPSAATLECIVHLHGWTPTYEGGVTEPRRAVKFFVTTRI